MSEERYDLKESKRSVRELYPILKDAHGNVIDGFHRLEIDPAWHDEILDWIKTPTQLWLARIIANTHRRTVSREERAAQIRELAKSLMENDGVPKEEIVSTIAELTTFTERYVRNLLPDEYKQRLGAGPSRVELSSTQTEADSQPLGDHPTEEAPANVAIESTITALVGIDPTEIKRRICEDHDVTEAEADEAIRRYRKAYPDIWGRCYPEKTVPTGTPEPPDTREKLPDEEAPALSPEEFVADYYARYPWDNPAARTYLVWRLGKDHGLEEGQALKLIDGYWKARRPKPRKGKATPAKPTAVCPLCGSRVAADVLELAVAEILNAHPEAARSLREVLR